MWFDVEGPGRGWHMQGPACGLLVAVSFLTSCHYVDPQCFSADLGRSARLQAGPLLNVSVRLPLHFRTKAYTEAFEFHVDATGGFLYMELDGDLSTCRRLGEERLEALAHAWSMAAVERSGSICGPGYSYIPPGQDCRAQRGKLAGRAYSSYSYPPSAAMTYYADDGPVSFLWDLDRKLPKELQEALTGTLDLLCEGSRRFGRKLRRSLPELAAEAGCLSGEAPSGG
ncbi:MAG: hypothetical protein OXG81_00130 [Acidobacteria bacterium]|nr:hypothetical protein [Acidobacteriota bacterium]